MLSPRLTNCPECANIPSLLKKIDCKLAELGNSLYNNISYMLNQPIPAGDILQLIAYRRILMHKYCNPNYVHEYSVAMIASRVIRLTLGCVSRCNEPERCLEEPCDITIVPNPPLTTTTTTTLPITTTTTSSTNTSTTSTSTTGVPTTTTTTTNGPAPSCPDRRVVFQICNSNAVVDDNFDIYLNGTYIGAVDLNANAQVGSVFIADSNPLVVLGSSDFVCPLTNMVTYHFPSSLLLASNVLEMRNTQNNGNGNVGSIGVRNYSLSGTTLSNPCVITNLGYSGASGASFTFNFNYTTCCAGDTTTTTSSSSSTTTSTTTAGGSTTTTTSSSSTTSTTTTLAPTGFNTIYTHFESFTPLTTTSSSTSTSSTSTTSTTIAPTSTTTSSTSSSTTTSTTTVPPTSTTTSSTSSTTTTTTTTVLSSVIVCGRTITDTNSTLTVLNDGTPIPYAANITDWNNHLTNGTPCYTYWEFNPTESYRGCLYNQTALNDLPPTGWRGLTQADVDYFYTCGPYQPKENQYAANTGNWDLVYWTDRSNAGETGLNFQGYGLASWSTFSGGTIQWIYDGIVELQGYSPAGVSPDYGSTINSSFGYIAWGGFNQDSENYPMYARFIKL